MRRGGGLINLEDLRNYRAIERKPLRGTFRGYDIISMPPPSSGGVALVEMLNLLEHNGIDKTSFRSPREVHLLTEAMRRAYADRARHLADTDFVPVPVEKLTSKKYARSLSATIHPRKASRSSPTTSRPSSAYGDDTSRHPSLHPGSTDHGNLCTVSQVFRGVDGRLGGADTSFIRGAEPNLSLCGFDGQHAVHQPNHLPRQAV